MNSKHKQNTKAFYLGTTQKAVWPGWSFSSQNTNIIEDTWTSFLPQFWGVLCVFLLSEMLRGGGWAFGEDDAEGKGCAWDVLGFANRLRKLLWHQLSEAAAYAKAPPKGQWPGIGKAVNKKSEKQKEIGETENPGGLKATQDLPEYCMGYSRSEPLQYAGQFTGYY